MKFKDYLNEEYEKYDDKEILREAIYEEYKATNIYTKMAKRTSNQEVKRLLLHVAEEEKHHVHEFKLLLNKLDTEYEEAEEEAEEEVKDMGINIPD